MIDKYINLSLVESFGLLKNWRSASTRLFLRLSSLSGVRFEGWVTLGEPVFPTKARFDLSDGALLEVSMVGAELLRASVEEPRLWFACRCESGLRFVLSPEASEEINLDDFVLASTQEQ